MSLKIVTDSVSDIPPHVAAELGISVIPVLVCFGEEVFRDGIDLTTEQFYEKLVKSEVLPTTAVPSLDIFARTFAKLAEETDEILAIMLSSKLSGAYNAALQSVGLMESDCRVVVVDSGSAVMAQGFIVIKAAQAAQAGASLDEVVEVVNKNIPRAEMRASLATLEFLQRGGRIGKAQAFLGSMLKINPIVTLKDGVVEPVSRVHSRAKAVDALYEYVASFKYIEELAVEDAACPEDGDILVERLGAIFPKERIYRSGTTPVIGAHTGPGLLLVAVLGDK
jgi:DegV family protein with EDD domain